MSRVPPRVGAVAAVLGALALALGTALHPMGADPGDLLAAFAEYAADPYWMATHLTQFLGVALMFVGLVAVHDQMEGEAAAWAARLGLLFGIAALAGAAVLQAVDGIALKIMVDGWSKVSEEEKESAFIAAFAVRQIEIGLASFLMLLFGSSMALYGAAIARARGFAHWLGWLGVIGGLGMVVSAGLAARTGFSPLEMTVSMAASAVALIWVVVVGIVLWRRGAR
jgi:hypothetical protein